MEATPQEPCCATATLQTIDNFSGTFIHPSLIHYSSEGRHRQGPSTSRIHNTESNTQGSSLDHSILSLSGPSFMAQHLHMCGTYDDVSRPPPTNFPCEARDLPATSHTPRTTPPPNPLKPIGPITPRGRGSVLPLPGGPIMTDRNHIELGGSTHIASTPPHPLRMVSSRILPPITRTINSNNQQHATNTNKNFSLNVVVEHDFGGTLPQRFTATRTTTTPPHTDEVASHSSTTHNQQSEAMTENEDEERPARSPEEPHLHTHATHAASTPNNNNNNNMRSTSSPLSTSNRLRPLEELLQSSRRKSSSSHNSHPQRLSPHNTNNRDVLQSGTPHISRAPTLQEDPLWLGTLDSITPIRAYFPSEVPTSRRAADDGQANTTALAIPSPPPPPRSLPYTLADAINKDEQHRNAPPAANNNPETTHMTTLSGPKIQHDDVRCEIPPVQMIGSMSYTLPTCVPCKSEVRAYNNATDEAAHPPSSTAEHIVQTPRADASAADGGAASLDL